MALLESQKMNNTVKKEDSTYIDHEQRITRLEANQNNSVNVMLRIENSLREMDLRIEKKFDKIDSRIWHNFYWMIGGFAGILAVMAHGFKWI